MKSFSFRRIAVTTLLLIFSCSLQAALNLSDPLPINPQLELGKLDNGLTYYIQKNTKPEKHVELRLVVKAGSILEDDDQQGLAHFLEHMAFNGSRHFKKHELVSYLQSLGIKFGADLNAYTSFDETVYILPIPVGSNDSKNNLETGFTVLEDWAQGLTLNDADIDAERSIILEEARLGKGADDRMGRKLYKELFNGSKYADRLPIGKEHIISQFKYDALKRFYTDWYRPDLMAVVVVGDIEPEHAEQMVKTHFSHLTNPKSPRPRNYAVIPVRSKSTSLVITDKEATSNTQLIQFPIKPSKQDTTVSDYRKSLIKQLSLSMLNQRLRDLTEQAKPPFIGGQSAVSPLAHGYESFESVALIGRSGVEPATNALIQENKRARQFGFTTDELERAKKNQQRTLETAYNERNKSESSGFAAEYIRHFLTDEAIPGIANEYAYVTELLPGITLNEVNDDVKKIIPDDSAAGTAKLVAYLGSNKEGEIIPTPPQLLTWLSTAELLPVVANVDQTTHACLMTHLPKAGRIIAETKNEKLGVTELTLSNGLTVLLKPSDYKSDQVLLSASRFGGQSLFDEVNKFNARYANAVVDSMGFATFTPTEIQKILAGKSLSFQTNSSNFIEKLSGYTASNDIESLFQLMHLRLANPSTDDDLYTAFIDRMQDISKNRMSKPESVFSDALLTTLYNDNPRVPLVPKPRDFDHISMEGATEVYRERFTSAHGFTFILAGSFTLEKIKPLIATYLASLPTATITTTYQDLNIRPVAGIIKKEVHSGTEDKSQLALIFTGPAQYSKEEDMRFNALVEVMNLRIIDVLREKLGLIYSGRVRGVIERIPYQNYRLDISLPCSPENVDQVIATTFAEIEKIKKEGATQEELNKVKLNWIKNNKIALRTNEYWINGLQNATLYHTDAADMLSVEKQINDVALTDVKDAAARYLNTGNYVQVVLYPEKK